MNRYESFNPVAVERQIDPSIYPLHGPEFRVRRRAFISQRLENNYPFRVTFLYAVVFVLIGFTQIGLQIFLIIHDFYNWEVCNGIWGGIACIIISILNLNLARKRSYWNYFFTLMTTYLMALVLVGAFGLVPASSIGQCTGSIVTDPRCSNVESLHATIVMLGLGIGAMLATLIYIFTFNTLLVGRCGTYLMLN